MEFRGGAISKSPFFFTTAVLETRRSLVQAPASPFAPLTKMSLFFGSASHFNTAQSIEVCILRIGHSHSRARASYPSCFTAYQHGSRSRVFTI